MTRLISLIGDHQLPNLLFIKEMEGKYDHLLFVTSRRMQGSGRGKHLERALGLPEGSVQRIIVSDEDLNEMLAGMKEYPFSPQDKYIVNLSCGTHIMSIGAYEFFAQFQSEFYYIPQGKNKIENVLTSADIPLHYRVNVKDYLALHGLRIECNEELCQTKEYTIELFERYKNAGYNRYKIPEIVNAKFLDNDNDKRYFSGIWFEEYTYHLIKDQMRIKDDCIYTGVKIYRTSSSEQNDNELDIIYTSGNELYIGECKISMAGTPDCRGIKLLEQYMYKLAAISKDFGLHVNPYIFTLHQFNKNKISMRALKRRMQILGIKGIIDGDDFKDGVLDVIN